MKTRVINTAEDLVSFREELTGRRIVEMVQASGGVLVSLPVGLGKSTNLDGVIPAALDGVYDLVQVLEPTRALIAERPLVANPPEDLRVVVLRPRPSHSCGQARNAEWARYESSGMGLLGRKRICGHCPEHQECFWPRQYGKALRGTSVIFATQSHLERDPEFVHNLKRWTKAKRPLLIVDENNAILTCFRRRITRNELEMWEGAVEKVLADCSDEEELGIVRQWQSFVHHVRMLHSTDDLRGPGWKVPRLWPSISVQLQEAGHSLYGPRFRYIGFNLQHYCRSRLASRELHPNGDITFALAPRTGADVLIYSGTTIPDFCEFRLGVKLIDPFGSYRFIHPGTRWYNIASRIGTRKYFAKNANQILDFFAGLVARRLTEGKRPLLVSKKMFISLCAKGMTERLKKLGWKHVRIATGRWDKEDLNDPNVIPLINYGVIGINLFNRFDCAFCLNSYFVPLPVVNQVVQDVTGEDVHIPLEITTGGVPLRRAVRPKRPGDQACDVVQLANQALRQQELDVVIQAVGRVRPFTQPREIIMFQASEHPLVTYEKEFSFLNEARAYFDVPTNRQAAARKLAAKIVALKMAGMSQSEAAANLDVSLSTVKRRWNGSGATSPI